MHDLDHLLWEEFDLEQAEERFLNLTGVAPAFGGTHPGGTHNSLLSLGSGRYLEIIAIDPARAEAFGYPTEAPPMFEPSLFTFGVKADDLALVEQLLERVGLSVSDIHQVTREQPDGTVLTWQSLVAGGHGFGKFFPFFTHFMGEVHPSESSPQGCELLEFSVSHPDAEELSRLYEALQVNVPVFQSDSPQLVAVLSTPKGDITLSN